MSGTDFCGETMNNRDRAQKLYQNKLEVDYLPLEERLKSKILEVLPGVYGIGLIRRSPLVSSGNWFSNDHIEISVAAVLEDIPELYFYYNSLVEGLYAAATDYESPRWDISSWVDVGHALACVAELDKRPKVVLEAWEKENG